MNVVLGTIIRQTRPLIKFHERFAMIGTRDGGAIVGEEERGGTGTGKTLDSSDIKKKKGPMAGIIVIGDEILSGQTHDTNSHFMCGRLRSLGVKVGRISVIPDQLDVIIEEVKKFSQNFDHVITSGGIGPTHDDVTYEGIARAFDHPIQLHPELVEILKKWAKTDDLEQPIFKMAKVSEKARLLFGFDPVTNEPTKLPIICVNNVYSFPGIPNLTRLAFPLVEDVLFRRPDNPTFYKRVIFIDAYETVVAPILDAFHAQYKDRGVALGSYPKWQHSYYKVKLTVESTDLFLLESSLSQLTTDLGKCVIPFDPTPTQDMGDKLKRLLLDASGTTSNNDVHAQINSPTPISKMLPKLKQAVDVLEECRRRYTDDEICLAFNGGKDCTALLYLFSAVRDMAGLPRDKGLKVIYIRKGNPFPEVEKFVEEMVKEFHLELITVSGGIKDSLKQIKADHPELKAVIMGTRKTDPHSSHLTSFTPTDPDWPPFMRVNPIIDWSYGDLWRYLRSLYLPYCSLYDQGYTSLGSADNTFPCPKLEYVDQFGRKAFYPAYKLKLEDEERDGRH